MVLSKILPNHWRGCIVCIYIYVVRFTCNMVLISLRESRDVTYSQSLASLVALSLYCIDCSITVRVPGRPYDHREPGSFADYGRFQVADPHLLVCVCRPAVVLDFPRHNFCFVVLCLFVVSTKETCAAGLPELRADGQG